MADPAYKALAALDVSGLTWGSFLIRNLLPVTLGNMAGGAGFVGAVYWYVYLKKSNRSEGV